MQLLGNSQRRPRANGGEAENRLALDSTGLPGVEKPRVACLGTERGTIQRGTALRGFPGTTRLEPGCHLYSLLSAFISE